ncbi:hypothetical protein [Nonomuraea insulae]|uniref:Uncharacterized protein n=1 Tax=Nonomuraea insulae TaxID=1616787 RepID=A0ABW1DA33_9ACTN
MNPRERAEAIKDVAARDWRDKKQPVIDKARGQNRLEFYQEPDFIYDKDGEIVGVDAWVRLYGPDGKELRVDPHRRIVNPPTVPRSGVQEMDTGKRDDRGQPIKDRILTPDPAVAFYEAVWDSVESVPNAKGWRTRGTVTTVFGVSGDGIVRGFSSNYSTARSTASQVSSSGSVGQSFSVSDYFCHEGFVGFDTSSLVDSDMVSAVELALWLETDSSNTDYTLEVRDRDWGASLELADYVAGASLGGFTRVATLTTSGIGAAGAYKAFASDATFLTVSNIKTGTVRLLVSSDRQRSGTAPTGIEMVTFSFSSASGTTQDPKLTITHAGIGSLPVFQPRPNRIWRLR